MYFFGCSLLLCCALNTLLNMLQTLLNENIYLHELHENGTALYLRSIDVRYKAFIFIRDDVI